MRNIIILLAIIILASCTVPSGDEGFKFNNPKFENMNDACKWVYENINYKKDRYDDWQLPQETIDRGYGDCEDMAILLMGIMQYQKGYQSEMLVVKLDNSIYHAVVRYNGKIYDCTSGTSNGNTNYKIIEVYNYNDAMNIAKYVKNY